MARMYAMRAVTPFPLMFYRIFTPIIHIGHPLWVKSFCGIVPHTYYYMRCNGKSRREKTLLA